jgi:hypothetical protein
LEKQETFMSNILSATDVEGGALLEFARKSGASAFYFYPGKSASEAQATSHEGGQAISEFSARMMQTGQITGELL